jgi:hypothetical protein
LAEDTAAHLKQPFLSQTIWLTDDTFVAVAGNVLTGESAAIIPIMEKYYITMLLLRPPVQI